MTSIRDSREARIPRHIQALLEKVGVWTVLPFCVAYLVGVGGIAFMIPPPSPGLSAEEIAHIYSVRAVRIRLAFALMLFTGPLSAAFIAVLVRHLRRIEGHWGVLTVSQLIAGVMFPLVLWLPMMFAEVAAFRPERAPEITQALNDMFWLCSFGLVGPVVVQALILAVATFIDRGAVPIFPRWFGYVNLWYAVLALPGGMIMFFRSGPLAWNGILGFWIPVAAFFVWMISIMWVLFQAIDREYASPQSAAQRAT